MFSGRTRVGVLAGVLAFAPVIAHGQSAPAAVDRQVAQLEALNARVRTANLASDAELVATAQARRRLIAQLMDTAPGEVLRLAIPSAVRDRLPAAARAQTEEQVELSGAIEVSYEDYRGFSRLRHVLRAARGRYSLHFATDPPDWTTGARVRVRGVRLDTMLALGGESTTTVAAAPSVSSAGTRNTLVVLVNFQDNPVQPYTTAYAADVVFNTTDGYLREASHGQVALSGDVLGWFTLGMNSTVCDPSMLATLAQQAAVNAGANLSVYSHLVYAFPGNACAWWGLGTVGGTPGQAWVNGSLLLDVAGHELGHNLGLFHSRNMDCGLSPIGASCTVSEYGDTLDLMGATKGHFNAFHKERIGWLAPGQVITVTGSGSYTVEPLETSTGGVKALKILKSVDPATGMRTFYYLELRQGIGYDAFMSGWVNVMNGVVIHTGSESSGRDGYLLDMTPETASWYDPALTAGRSFADPNAGISVTTISAGATGATVSIVMDPGTCTPASPGVTLSPGAPAAVTAGTTLAYAVTVMNNDAPGCPATTFALSQTAPAGWTATLDASSVSLAPGAAWTTTMRVTSPGNALGGTYSLSVSVLDAAVAVHQGTGTGTYTVAAPQPPAPTLQVVTDRSTYSRGETVVVSARVLAGTAPVAGASVAFQVRKADGGVAKGTATTDSAGNAVYRVRLRQKDPVGTYQATATASGLSATASFTVR